MMIIIVITFNVRIAVAINIINKWCLRVIAVLDLPNSAPHNNGTKFSYIFSTFKTRAHGNIFNMPDVI